MNYEIINRLWELSVLLALLIWTFLIFRLVIAVVKRKNETIRSSIKYLVNTFTFVFVYFVYFSFSIVVQAPHGKTRSESMRLLNEWVSEEALSWGIWASILVGLLTLFNVLYQRKVEKVHSTPQTIALGILNVAIVGLGILLGSYNAIYGLTEEINRFNW
jgi:NADH:ubiquinone oxidoreductase subunit 4 (subunit M)